MWRHFMADEEEAQILRRSIRNIKWGSPHRAASLQQFRLTLQIGHAMHTSHDTANLSVLRDLVRQFVDERDWAQFHTPKNLAMAMSIEAAEVMEHFQWLPTGNELNADKRRAVGHELADVLVYLVRLADTLDIDLPVAISEKMQINREKYPAHKVRGDARKYDEYE
jgi:dCTP diphosphatase